MDVLPWNSANDKLSGAFVFTGTRIPVATLFENIKAGATVDEFLEWFPGSDRSQVEEVLSFLAEKIRRKPRENPLDQGSLAIVARYNGNFPSEIQ